MAVENGGSNKMSKPKSVSGANGRANLSSTPSLSKEELALAGRRKLEEFRKKKAGEKMAAKKKQAAAMAAVEAIPSSSSSSSAVNSEQVLETASSFTSREHFTPTFNVEAIESSSFSTDIHAVNETATSDFISVGGKSHPDESIGDGNRSELGEAPTLISGQSEGGRSKIELKERAEAEERDERKRVDERKEREEREERKEREEKKEIEEKKEREEKKMREEKKEKEEREARKQREEREVRKEREEREARKEREEREVRKEREEREAREHKEGEERERKAREERERKLRGERERISREERERKSREEREKKSREENERKAREEIERKAREERERKALDERVRKVGEESERKAREERERKARDEKIEKEMRERVRAENGATTTSISPPKPIVRSHLISPGAPVLPSPPPNVFRPLRPNDLQTSVVKNLNGKGSSPIQVPTPDKVQKEDNESKRPTNGKELIQSSVNESSILEQKGKAGESMGAVLMPTNRGVPVRLDSIFGVGPAHLGDGVGESNKSGIGAPSSTPTKRPPPPWLARPKPPSPNVTTASPPTPPPVFRQHLLSTVSPPFPSSAFRPQLPSDHESNIVKNINGKEDTPVDSPARDNGHKEDFESKHKGSDRSHEKPLTHSSALNDFSALEQHIEDLTKEKFSLQHGLESARALSESLAQENSSLMDDFNTQGERERLPQGAAITQLKQEIERLRKEIQAQQLVLASSRLERERAEDEKSSAVERSQTLAAEVIGLEEKVLRMRSQELKVKQSVDRLTSELEAQKRAMGSLEKDRANLRGQIASLQEEKRNLQSRLRKAAVGGALKDMVGPSNSDVGSNRLDCATSTEDLEIQSRSNVSSTLVSNAITSVDAETSSSRVVEAVGEGSSELREDRGSLAEPGPQTSIASENSINTPVSSEETPEALLRTEETGEKSKTGEKPEKPEDSEGRGVGDQGENEEPKGIPESASIRRVTSAINAAFAAALATPGATWHQSFSMHIPEELDSLSEDDQRSIQSIDTLLDEIRDERRALVRVVNAEAAAAAELRASNADLSRKLAIQTQRLELAVAQNMAASRSSTMVDNSTLDSLTYNREYIDEGDEVAERVLTWILRLFPGTRRSNSIRQ